MLSNSKTSNGFYVIWLYWAKKYMSVHIPLRGSIDQILLQLKKHYSLQSLDSRQLLDSRVSAIKQQKGGVQWPIYIIDPQRQLLSMQQALKDEEQQFKNELYSYYLNIKNVFIVYRNEWEGSQHLSSHGGSDKHHDNISEGNQGYKMPIKVHDNRTQGNKSHPEQIYSSSIINKYFHSLQDQSMDSRNQTIYETMHHKIQDLQILDKIAELADGFQIWNCRYKHIPHSFVKLKSDSWKTCFQLPLMHPSQPKFINNLPILPKIQPLQPNIDKLLPFVSYLKLLDKYFPGFSPTIDSIFQINDLPIVLSKQDESGWGQECNVGVLCYYVVNGADYNLDVNRVEKWAEFHSNTLLGKTIKEMTKRQREKKKQKRSVESKPLVLFDGDHEGQHIW